MPVLDSTATNVAIAHLAVAFHSSLTTIQWVATGYTLALVTVIPVTGWAADRLGLKRIYMTSLIFFTAGSVASGMSWSTDSLILFRVLQGLGGGMIMPSVITILAKKGGRSGMGRAMSLMGVPMLLAPIFGPMLGGWLVDDVSWRWIFFVNVPVGIVAFATALSVLESDQPQPSERFDWVGLLLLSPGLAVFIYGLAESSSRGLASPRAGGPIVLGAIFCGTFLLHSWPAAAPLIDVRTFVRTGAGVAAATLLLFSLAVIGAMLLQPLYFQEVRDASALSAGLLIAPAGVAGMITMSFAGRLADRYGPGMLPISGMPLVALGLLPFVLVGPRTPYILLSSGNFVMGLGMGLTMMTLMTAALKAVPATAIARTSTGMNIVRQGGGSLGTALLSVVLASSIKSEVGSVKGLQEASSGGLGAIKRLAPADHALIVAPLAHAFGSTFIWALVAVALASIPALRMATTRRDRRAEAVPVIDASVS